MEDELISVGALHALVYCEHLFYLEEVERIRIADAAVFAGRRLHVELEDGDEAIERQTFESGQLGAGERVQYSIFRCRLDRRDVERLRWELARVMAPEDSLLVVNLCPTCASNVVARNHVEGWGDTASNISYHR